MSFVFIIVKVISVVDFIKKWFKSGSRYLTKSVIIGIYKKSIITWSLHTLLFYTKLDSDFVRLSNKSS